MRVPRTKRPVHVSVNSVFSFSNELSSLWPALGNTCFAVFHFPDCKHVLTACKVGFACVADIVSSRVIAFDTAYMAIQYVRL